MSSLARILSRPTAKPYRTGDLESSEKPFVNDKGQVDFSPDDVENPHNWSTARRWYVTFASVLLVVNATFASSSPSGCFPVSSVISLLPTLMVLVLIMLKSIAEDFGVSEEVAGLTITLFLLGYCAGPLVFAPLSEVSI